MHRQKYNEGGVDGAFPRLMLLPRKLQGTAMRACYPSIDSKLTWAICLNVQDVPQFRDMMCSALSSLTSLATVSFCLSPGPGSTAEQQPMDRELQQQLDEIAHSICKLPRLSSLRITTRGVNDYAVRGFFRSLPGTAALQVLSLQFDSPDDRIAFDLLHTLPHLPHLHSFSLTMHSQLSHTAEMALRLCFPKLHKLRSLHLSHASFAVSTAARILSACVRLRLHTLSLTQQYTPDLTDHDDSLARAIGNITSLYDLSIHTNSPLPSFGQHLLLHCIKLTSLKRLSISGALQATCADSFAEFLQNVELNELQVSGTPRQAACAGGTPAVAQRMCVLPTNTYALQLARMQHLTSLDLSDTPAAVLCAGGMLEAALPQMLWLWRLKWVCLPAEKNGCGWHAAASIAGAIAAVPALQELHMSGADLAHHLTPYFPTMPHLRKVVMCGRIPWDTRANWPHLCDFRTLASLTDVRLIGNGSGPDVVSKFAGVLMGMADLKVLMLSYQRLDYFNAANLAFALWPHKVIGEKRLRDNMRQGLKQLYMLGLGGCGMDAATLGVLSPALHGLASLELKQVMLWGNDTEAAVGLSWSLLQANPDLVIDSVAPGLV